MACQNVDADADVNAMSMGMQEYECEYTMSENAV